MKKQEQPSFEESYDRLEEILEKMNSASISLEESLTLYEEADKLIALCSTKLDEAEKKIETMVKNRDGKYLEDEEGNPIVEDFQTDNDQILTRDN